MKVKTTTSNTKEREYPYLGRTESDKIVLFISPGKGVVLKTGHGPGHDYVGKFVETWIENNFTPFNGTVELSN